MLLLNVDMDECASGDHNCLSGTATCANTVGSYSCSCKNGYVGDGTTSCVPNGGCYFANIVIFWETDKKLGQGNLLSRGSLRSSRKLGRVRDET